MLIGSSLLAHLRDGADNTDKSGLTKGREKANENCDFSSSYLVFVVLCFFYTFCVSRTLIQYWESTYGVSSTKTV